MNREKYVKCAEVSTSTAYTAAAGLPIHLRSGQAKPIRIRPKIAGIIRAVKSVAPKIL